MVDCQINEGLPTVCFVIGIGHQGKSTLVNEIKAIREVSVVNSPKDSTVEHAVWCIQNAWLHFGPEAVLIYDGFPWPDAVAHDRKAIIQESVKSSDQLITTHSRRASFVYVSPKTLPRYLERKPDVHDYKQEVRRLNEILAQYEAFLRYTKLPFMRINSDDWLGLHEAIQVYDFATDYANIRNLADRR